MLSNSHTLTGRTGRPLHHAREKTGRIQRQLAIAGAELGLTNAVLDHSIPKGVQRSADVQRALTQNTVIEDKVQEAADELQVVSDLLDEEMAERKRLELELSRRPPN